MIGIGKQLQFSHDNGCCTIIHILSDITSAIDGTELKRVHREKKLIV